MKKKGFFAFILIASIIISSLAACSQPTETPEISTDATTVSENNAPVFMLEKLPDIGSYVSDTVYSRRYPEKRETLTPGEDYGKLIPFVGTFKEYNFVDYETGEWEEETYSFSKVGLMTTQGEIIVDAVYDYHDTYELDNGDYFIILERYDDEFSESLICSSDGSWVINKDNCNLYYPYENKDEDVIILTDFSDIDWETETGSVKLMVYDTSGNLLFEKENCSPAYQGGYSEGYFAVSICENYFGDDSVDRFIDIDGNIAFEDISPQSSFSNGIAIAKNSDGEYGLFSVDGDWIQKPIFESIYQRGDYYICSVSGLYLIIDKNGNTVDTVAKSKVGERDIEFFGGNMYYVFTDYSYAEATSFYTNAMTDALIMCKEINQPATNRIYDTDYFYCTDDTHTFTYIVDVNGNTLTKLDGRGTITIINDDYFYYTKGRYTDSTNEISVYSFKDFKKLWSGTAKNTGDAVTFWMYDTYAVKAYATEESLSASLTPYRTYDILSLESGEPIVENAKKYSFSKINGACYLNYTDGTYTYVLDPELNVLMKTPNKYND